MHTRLEGESRKNGAEPGMTSIMVTRCGAGADCSCYFCDCLAVSSTPNRSDIPKLLMFFCWASSGFLTIFAGRRESRRHPDQPSLVPPISPTLASSSINPPSTKL
uniref:Uncharacterized protein n=1 Tax=Candidatus Kentrum eta TaxID=2126337 RepID=A0A450VHI6_9GAMM|nr:MAG: hypothetical protein BECKH772B_GA0070898_104155 [Candidatus Kentron sp. H]VFK04361.1 MAG: hypothetical protein BECKH772A_GA0070896_104076 [Candidatus Kentron sp. H]VFK07373.1 MAG: hypothetical protein BECKH772C_GA0070978_104155 [Candidatus Kentron sp. H]